MISKSYRNLTHQWTSIVTFVVLKRQEVMGRAFSALEDCVQDAVMAAAGAFESASLGDVITAIARRCPCYYDSGTLPRT